jgi:hypothetical protein
MKYELRIKNYFVTLRANEESQEQRAAALLYSRGENDDTEGKALAHRQSEYSLDFSTDIGNGHVLH